MHSFFSGAQRNGVFSSKDVLLCKAMCGDVVASAWACSQAQSHDSGTEARRAKTSAEGFLRFLPSLNHFLGIFFVVSKLSINFVPDMGRIMPCCDVKSHNSPYLFTN